MQCTDGPQLPITECPVLAAGHLGWILGLIGLLAGPGSNLIMMDWNESSISQSARTRRVHEVCDLFPGSRGAPADRGSPFESRHKEIRNAATSVAESQQLLLGQMMMNAGPHEQR